MWPLCVCVCDRCVCFSCTDFFLKITAFGMFVEVNLVVGNLTYVKMLWNLMGWWSCLCVCPSLPPHTCPSLGLSVCLSVSIFMTLQHVSVLIDFNVVCSLCSLWVKLSVLGWAALCCSFSVIGEQIRIVVNSSKFCDYFHCLTEISIL